MLYFSLGYILHYIWFPKRTVAVCTCLQTFIALGLCPGVVCDQGWFYIAYIRVCARLRLLCSHVLVWVIGFGLDWFIMTQCLAQLVLWTVSSVRLGQRNKAAMELLRKLHKLDLGPEIERGSHSIYFIIFYAWRPCKCSLSQCDTHIYYAVRSKHV